MTDEIFYKGELNENRISAYKKLAENYRVEEGTVRDIFSQGIAFAVSHTAAHTAVLREELDASKEDLSGERILLEAARKQLSVYEERVKELEEIIVGINSCQMVGITWPNELKQKVEKIWEAAE